VLGIGPGLLWSFNPNQHLFVNVYVEVEAKNRPEGERYSGPLRASFLNGPIETDALGRTGYTVRMKLNLDRPIAFLDIESTGANWRTDRIIDLALILVRPDGRSSRCSSASIPASRFRRSRRRSTASPTPTSRTSRSSRPWPTRSWNASKGCDLAGYNLTRFDIPMLQAEYARLKKKFPMDGRRVVDVQRIFHRKEPRDLTAAVKYYCGREHAGAHGAMEDTEATLRVFEAQLARYDDLPRDIDGLAEYTRTGPSDAFDAQGKLRWDADGDVVLGFGVFKGAKLRVLAEKDKGYLDWMLRKEFGPEVEDAVRAALAGNAPRRGG
jgi:DNA polymerase III subunit epsilon